MENNQQTSDLATVVLTQIYSDYQKEKKWARYYRYAYYFVMMVLVALVASMCCGKSSESDAGIPKKPFVAVVKIHGALGLDDGINYREMNELLETAFKSENTVGVVLDVDSPGGIIYDTYMIYEKIQQMKQKYPEKKITTYVRSLSASAGYWLSVSSDHIYAAPVSIIGSIGVRLGSNLYDFSELLKEHKIGVTSIYCGRFKTMGDSTRPLTEEEKGVIQAQLNESYEMFKNVVQTRRGDKLDKEDPDLFSGLTWSGTVAQKKGLIDRCDLSFEEMIKEEYGDYEFTYVKRKAPDFSLAGLIKELKEGMLMSQGFLDPAVQLRNANRMYA